MKCCIAVLPSGVSHLAVALEVEADAVTSPIMASRDVVRGVCLMAALLGMPGHQLVSVLGRPSDQVPRCQLLCITFLPLPEQVVWKHQKPRGLG